MGGSKKKNKKARKVDNEVQEVPDLDKILADMKQKWEEEKAALLAQKAQIQKGCEEMQGKIKAKAQ